MMTPDEEHAADLALDAKAEACIALVRSKLGSIYTATLISQLVDECREIGVEARFEVGDWSLMMHLTDDGLMRMWTVANLVLA